MTVATAVARLQTIAGAVSGVNVAATLPPESLAQFPVAISYVSDCLLGARYTGAHAHSQWVLTTEIHVSRKDLPRDYDLLDDIGPAFAVAVIAEPDLTGTVSAVIETHGTLGPGQWAGLDTLCWTFKTTVDIRNS
jgi:hypothetical protein